MSEPHVASLEPGTVIGGKYEVVRCLGAGSMGMVYACRHRELQGQLVAAKVLFNEVASDAIAAARFKNEILASYGVSHPNVVRAYEFVRDDDMVAYTMEFVGGGDLADRMARPELMGIGEILRLLSQMAAGVQAIHDAGIVHRDLKPENILLTNEGSVKIADFGIARKTDGPKLTEHGGVVGTLEYVSPEYMLRSQVDWRSDIYALGVLAFELVTGEAPFKGDSAYASISKRLQSDPDAPSTYRRECPQALDTIILKALMRDPEERYQSALEMFYDLQQVALALGVGDGNSAGILIPPASTVSGKRYVGPTLSKPVHADGQGAETQVLTSDGSIDYPGGAVRPGGVHLRRAEAEEKDVVAESVRDGVDARSRQATDFLDPASRFSSSQQAKVSKVLDEGDSSVRREQSWNDSSTSDFTSDLVARSNRRLWTLDLVILVFAALSGIGAGYLFLRIFAPSFLERLGFMGLG